MDSLRNSYGNGNPFNTYDMRCNAAREERKVNSEIEHLLEIAKNKKFSKRRRRSAYNEALELCKSFHGAGFGSSDESAEEHINSTTDSDNSSVSSVSQVSSETEDMKEILKEFFDVETSSGYHDEYLCELEERKAEKRRTLKLQKREAKRALIAIERRRRDEIEQRRRDEIERQQVMQQKSKILDDAVKSPFEPDNIMILFAELRFFWNPVTGSFTRDGSKYQLFKDDPLPSKAKILEEIGPVAWDNILKKAFSKAYYELYFFRNQKEAEESSSIFTGSLFDDSEADDERDD
jgi:hypothetical protein